MQDKIDQLIINSPYKEPTKYWVYDRETKTFSLKEGRRPAGYVVASEKSKSFDDPGIFVEIPLVNKIRQRVKSWRENGYTGVTGITKRLLEHWYNLEERNEQPFFFCQLDAMETLIWLLEAPQSDKVGIDIPSDGGLFKRLCSKMATGSGKTIVMAMLIAWQVLNKVTYPQDTRYSKNIFVVAPGLTVKSRLQVLIPSNPDNYYTQFNVIPAGLFEKLRQGKIIIRNWHILNWESEDKIAKKKGVDKRGAKSDEAYVREVLEDMSNAKNIVVINDEAHHAWRLLSDNKVKGVSKEEIDEATKWVGGLDRIHKARGILNCFDFSATPFIPTGKKSSDEMLFNWIVSDFSLNDAIEAGLVKTPRVVIRDDGRLTKEYKSRFYHIYNDSEVKDNLNVALDETNPLPDLVIQAYNILGADWFETKKLWEKSNQKTPPVIITVANRTETSARIKYTFDHKRGILIDELCNPELTLQIDSKILNDAESREENKDKNVELVSDGEDKPERKMSKKEYAEELRKKVDTVGKPNEIGEKIQNVISIGMLTEGWDAKTVTHIMGLRAFTSQLLCEQVVGRGLRRTSYEINKETGFFEAEYVNIFGIPFTFLPHETKDGPPPIPASPKTRIEPLLAKHEYEIKFPNIIRIEHTYKPTLTLDKDKIGILELDAYNTPTIAELAPTIDGKPDLTKISEIQLEELLKDRSRIQTNIFNISISVYEQLKEKWKGNKDYLLKQLINIIDDYIKSDRIRIIPELFNQNELRRRIMIMQNLSKIIGHIKDAINFNNTEKTLPIYSTDRPIRSTADMQVWYTGKPCEITKKSHISHCVYDSTWEASEAFELDKNPNVLAWVKNDHLGFEIIYIYEGIIRKYRPDFIVKLINGINLVLET